MLTVISVTVGISILLYIFYVLSWFELLGLFFIKTILGFKIGGVKSFGKALLRIGGKKVLLLSTAGMLLKRHIIDLSSKFFTEHSVQRYSESIKKIAIMQFNKVRYSSLSKKIQGFFALLLSIPLISFFWTKVLSAVAQKLLYKMFYPIFLMIFTFLKNSFSFIGGLFTLFFQLLFIDFFSNLFRRSKLGKSVIAVFSFLFSLFGRVLSFFNRLLILIGIDIRHLLISYSITINKWLENIIYKKYSKRKRILIKRELRSSARGVLMKKRKAYVVFKKKKTQSIGKIVKSFLFRKKKPTKRVSFRDALQKRRSGRRLCHSPRHKRIVC
jgi:hypothetical protein